MKESAETETARYDVAPSLQQLIAGHPFLKGMISEHLSALAECAMAVEFVTDELIFRVGDPANRFYLILSGGVVVESDSNGSPVVPIETLGAGDVLGWSWLFPPYTWHLNARATEPTRAIFFYGTRLRERCEGQTDLGYELMRRMAEVVIQRLQATRRQLIAKERRPPPRTV